MKTKAFTLAETLIVIGIIGVVAALTLPNLNHATGDKETVTRVNKIYSALSDANDRAVATYGPLSGWSEECKENFYNCWLGRIGEFMKVSKSCITEYNEENESSVGCEQYTDVYGVGSAFLQLADGAVIAVPRDNDTDLGSIPTCEGNDGTHSDICLLAVMVDIDGPQRGKNSPSDPNGKDMFGFTVSDGIGVMPFTYFIPATGLCFEGTRFACTSWVIEHGNLDYLKAGSDGKCIDNESIVLDGVTNTSCH